VVLDKGQMTTALPGRVLRGPGYKPKPAPQSPAAVPDAAPVRAAATTALPVER
jgi:hypothetical protein